uniref:Mlo8 n=1 Tax=Arundo donax TaxID=35708 RepID=A0A0A9B0H9_ARUDO
MCDSQNKYENVQLM